MEQYREARVYILLTGQVEIVIWNEFFKNKKHTKLFQVLFFRIYKIPVSSILMSLYTRFAYNLQIPKLRPRDHCHGNVIWKTLRGHGAHLHRSTAAHYMGQKSEVFLTI